jgi:hypothetical protein
MAAPEVLELFREEYLALLQTYEDYNHQSLLIKGWSVTVGAGTVLAAYLAASDARPSRLGVAIASCSVLPFIFTDTLWKALQNNYLPRLKALEAAICRQAVPTDPSTCAEDGLATPAAAPFQFVTTWEAVTLSDFFAAMGTSTVWLPHAPIFVAGMALAFLARPAASRRRIEQKGTSP